MSIFERYLTLWVALCIVVGIALGHIMPGAFQAIGAAEIARVRPAAMVFCSSTGGISHAAVEDTPEADLVAGIEAFARLAAATLS